MQDIVREQFEERVVLLVVKPNLFDQPGLVRNLVAQYVIALLDFGAQDAVKVGLARAERFFWVDELLGVPPDDRVDAPPAGEESVLLHATPGRGFNRLREAALLVRVAGES